MVDKKSRDTETREADARTQTWRRPELLPTPAPEEGYVFRWVRTSMLGVNDNKNVSSKFREGWQPVAAADHADLHIVGDLDSRFPDNLEVGGLILCKCPKEVMEQRSAAQQQQSKGQMEAVDNNYLRQSDPRMPVLNPERSTRTSFGD